MAAKSAATLPPPSRASGLSPTASAATPPVPLREALTRRYHGLLIAALQPPVGRTQLVASIDEVVHYSGSDFSLATHRWSSGAIDPKGFLNLESFHLEGTKPVWTYALADALLEKRVWMRQGENTTYIQYTLVRGSSAIEMECKALVNYRDFHSSTHAGDWRMKIEPVERGVKVVAFDAATPFYLLSAEAACEPRHEWYRGCYLAEETARGLDDHEDHLFVALFRAKLRRRRQRHDCCDHGSRGCPGRRNGQRAARQS